eukprot:evm.model.scf_104.4 EVM.evm.TU.scf_104.4   scf_104:31613-35930(+)
MKAAAFLLLLGATLVAAIPGAPLQSVVDVESLHVSDFAVTKINEATPVEDGEPAPQLELVQVLNATKQVVAGWKFSLVLLVQAGEAKAIMSAVVYVPAVGDAQLMDHDVVTGDDIVPEDIKDIREYQQFSVVDEEVKAAADAAVEKTNARSNSLVRTELDGVLDAWCKVASGQGTTCRLDLSLMRGQEESYVEVVMNRNLTTGWRVMSMGEVPVPVT